MEAHKIRIQIGIARAELRAAYETQHRPIHFDIVVQAHLHCRHIAGVPSAYDVQVEKLESLEYQLEEVTKQVFLPYWRARRTFMSDLVESGSVSAENIERASEFLALIEERLAGDDAPKAPQPEEHGYLREMLHPVILESSWAQFRTGQLRDAVLNAYVALGDLIRERTGLHQDGKPLVEQALSIGDPKLILSVIDTDSGRNDQLGFMQILSGAFVGIRNPKAHSLQHDLDLQKAAHYLVLASLLARRISEAKKMS